MGIVGIDPKISTVDAAHSLFARRTAKQIKLFALETREIFGSRPSMTRMGYSMPISLEPR